jgi:hypothetical protein
MNQNYSLLPTSHLPLIQMKFCTKEHLLFVYIQKFHSQRLMNLDRQSFNDGAMEVELELTQILRCYYSLFKIHREPALSQVTTIVSELQSIQSYLLYFDKFPLQVCKLIKN